MSERSPSSSESEGLTDQPSESLKSSLEAKGSSLEAILFYGSRVSGQ
jgi:hypothetical protein